MNGLTRILVVAAVACATAGTAFAQQGRGRPDEQGRGRPDGAWATRAHPQTYPRGPSSGGMSSEQRERLRQEVNSAGRGAYRESGPPPEYDPRRPPQRPMAPWERDRLRRDIQDANRDFERGPNRDFERRPNRDFERGPNRDFERRPNRDFERRPNRDFERRR